MLLLIGGMACGRTISHKSSRTKLHQQILNTSVDNGLPGANVLKSVVVVCKPALTITWMVPSVASHAHTVTVTSSNVSATLLLALLIVKASGASTLHAPPHAVAVFSPECSQSPQRLCMVAKRVRRPMVPWRIPRAAPSSARRTARVIGMTGPNAPMVELDPMVWSVALVGPKAVGTSSPKSTRQVVVVALLLSGQT